MDNSNHDLTVKEAGAKGGRATLERHGRSHYAVIGKMGGQRTRELYGKLLKEVSKRGGRPRRPALHNNMGEEYPD